ncbi:MAG: hypothetical protein V1740_02630 [Candidatus Woesearchaeota archaeon]
MEMKTGTNGKSGIKGVFHSRSVVKALFSRIILTYLAIAIMIFANVAFASQEKGDPSLVYNFQASQAIELGSFGKLSPVTDDNIYTKKDRTALLTPTDTIVPVQGRVYYNGDNYNGNNVDVCIDATCNNGVAAANGIFNTDILFNLEDPHSPHNVTVTVNGTEMINKQFYLAGGPQGDLDVNGNLRIGGKVGIGTASPNSTLHINSDVPVGEKILNIETPNNAEAFSISEDKILFIGNNTDANLILDKHKSTGLGPSISLRHSRGVLGDIQPLQSGDIVGGIDFMGWSSNVSNGWAIIYVIATDNYSNNYEPKRMGFEMDSGNGVEYPLSLISGEKVGIATQTPGYTLDVNGTANASQFCLNNTCINDWTSAGSDDADSDPTNEIQVLGRNGNNITLSNGGGTVIDNVNDADANSTNEIQFLGINGDTITLTDGGAIIAPYADDADTVDSQHYNSNWPTTLANIQSAALNDFHNIGGAETDPEVGTLTNGRWCTTDGSTITCTQTAPVLTETDPQVGVNTLNYVSKWDGSALVKGSIFDNGYAGIGTTTPDAPLQISGGTTMNSGWGRTLTLTHTYPVVVFEGTGASAGIGYDYSNGMKFFLNATSNNVTSVSPKMTILNSGDVGIGTSYPGAKLDVAGDIRVNSTSDVCIQGGNCLSSAGSGTVTSVGAGAGLTNSGTATDPVLNVGTGTGITVSADSIAATLGTAVDSSEITDGAIVNADISAAAAISNTKIAGLGALATLSSVSGGVGGTIADNTITADDLAPNSVQDSELMDGGSWTIGSNTLNIDSNTLVVDGANNRVGIGTTSPREKLSVVGNISAEPNVGTVFGTGGRIGFVRNSDGWITGGMETLYSGGGYQSDLIFYTNVGASATDVTEKMRILDTGYVGIGTATPGAKLDVAGNIQSSGDYYGGARLYPAYTTNPSAMIDGSTAGQLNINAPSYVTFYVNGAEQLSVAGNKVYTQPNVKVGLGISNPETRLHTEDATAANSKIIFRTTDTGASPQELSLEHISVSPAAGDNLSRILFVGNDSSDNTVKTFASIESTYMGSSSSKLYIKNRQQGNINPQITIDGTAGQSSVSIGPESGGGWITNLRIGHGGLCVGFGGCTPPGFGSASFAERINVGDNSVYSITKNITLGYYEPDIKIVATNQINASRIEMNEDGTPGDGAIMAYSNTILDGIGIYIYEGYYHQNNIRINSTSVITPKNLEVGGAISTGNGGIKWKTFSGNTDAVGTANFAHGLTGSTIIYVACSVEHTAGNYYPVIRDSTRFTEMYWNTNNIYFDSNDFNFYNSPYRCNAMYVE